MSEMVDRVAKAMFPNLWDLEAAQEKARAAIGAMREPTQNMLDHVTAADQHEPFSAKTMRSVYREMIGAALDPT